MFRRRIRATKLVTITGTLSLIAARGFAGESIIAQSGRSYSIDFRPFIQRGEPVLRESPGILTRGGYCQFGAKLEARAFRCDIDDSADVAVEIVRHPREYAFAIHDLIGTLRAAARLTISSNSEPNSQDDQVRVECISWSSVGAAGHQTIGFASLGTDAESGIVGWYGDGATTNGVVTVCIRYESLRGLPRTVIDYLLAMYPSSLRVEDFQRDWTDDDLGKWIQILRAAPRNNVVIQTVRHHLIDYEKSAGQTWDAGALHVSQTNSEQWPTRCEQIAARVEQWRRSRRSAD